jgi:hypothetical protein
MTAMETPEPLSTPIAIRYGVWLIAGTLVADPYPCRCTPPCRTKGERTCPCIGRTDLGHVPPSCCAAIAAKSTAWRATTLTTVAPVPRRWAAPAHHWHAPAEPLGADIRRPPRWAAPITEQQHDWAWPIRVLEPWQRQSRHPHPGEADCDICGELLAEQLVRQGYTTHVGC